MYLVNVVVYLFTVYIGFASFWEEYFCDTPCLLSRVDNQTPQDLGHGHHHHNHHHRRRRRHHDHQHHHHHHGNHDHDHDNQGGRADAARPWSRAPFGHRLHRCLPHTE